MSHVLMIARSYPTEQYKTHGIFEADYAHGLAKAGIKVSFIALDMRSFLRKRPFGVRVSKEGEINLYRIDWPIGNLPKGIYYPIVYKALKKMYNRVVKEQGKPDLLHAVFTDYAYLAALLKKETGIPLYVCEPNSHINQKVIEPSLKEAARIAYNTADVVQAVSPRFQTKLKEEFGIDTVNIPILPSLGTFHYSNEPPAKKIVSTGRLTKEKGMFELVDAFIRFRKETPEYVFHIFGGGDAHNELEQKIRAATMEDCIFLRGIVDRQVIAKEYEDAQFFALCSHHETFGLSYIEAWASGLPVLATRCGGPEHLFRDENGRYVPVGDTDAIYEAMNEMATTVFNRAHIAQWAHQEFSEEKIIGDIIEQYNRILKKGECQ